MRAGVLGRYNRTARIDTVGVGDARAGFALMAALLVALLLSTLGTSFVLTARTMSVATRTEIDVARLRARADAGARYAILTLLRRDAAPSREERQDWRFDGGAVRIGIVPETPKVDLNTASRAQLQALFLDAGEPEDRAAALVNAILAYRLTDGADPSAGLPSPTQDTPLRLRISWELDNRAFDTVRELRRVPGLSPTLFTKIEPMLTVHGRARYNASGAPREGDAGSAYTITAEAVGPDDGRFVRRAIVAIHPLQAPGYTIRNWKRGGY